ncbi:hypothetical protein SK128_002034 [Halocaridina rubra]|uniref:Tip elongation aberrant protein 1 n=1 Tax=Halocaridina rubra TaxID=373956 RepID=A0AAN8XB49_HALRR
MEKITRTWHEIREDSGARPPSLQQHTMIVSKGRIMVFGGELCMSNETPLWIYTPQTRVWRKWQWAGGGHSSGAGGGGNRGRREGACGPTGRRGHSAVVAGEHMIIYGGYQDLRGSSAEMWSFHLENETWNQLSSRGEQPAARHAHSAVLHDNQMWVYGGMTDLQERNDFWRYDTVGRTWTQIRSRPSPGYLHSHVSAKLHSAMIIFGGERQGEILNDLWRYYFATGTWERLMSSGIKPQPRSQFCAFVAPSHHMKGPRFHSSHSGLGSSSTSSSSYSSSGYSSSHSHDSYRTRRVHPNDSGATSGTFQSSIKSTGGSCDDSHECVCHECDVDEEDLDPSRLRSLIQRNCSNAPTAQLKLSISKFSQLNLSHLGRYYSYSMLSNDSTESIVEESLASTCDSVGSKIVKSQSIHVMNKDNDSKQERGRSGMTRDIVSVPNFGDVTDEEYEGQVTSQMPINHVKVITVLPAEGTEEASLEDDPSDIMAGIKGRLTFNHEDTLQSTDTSISENLMSFSCTTDSNLSSNTNLYGAYNYNVGGLNSFANPNYVGFDPGQDSSCLLSKDYWRTGALDLESARHKEFAEMLRTPPDSGIGLGVEMERRTPLDLTLTTLEDFVTFDNQTARFNKTHPADTQPIDANTNGTNTTDASTTHKTSSTTKVTFSSSPSQVCRGTSGQPSQGNYNTSGGGAQPPSRMNPFMKPEPIYESDSPSAMYIMGGKETDHMTAFKRPISIWKLDLPF